MIMLEEFECVYGGYVCVQLISAIGAVIVYLSFGGVYEDAVERQRREGLYLHRYIDVFNQLNICSLGKRAR